METYHRPRIARETLIALTVCFFVAFFAVVAIVFGVISAIFPLIVSIAGIVWLGWSIRQWMITPETEEEEADNHETKGK